MKISSLLLMAMWILWPAAAPGQIILLDDPLNGSTSGHQDGGSFSGGGWQAPRQIWWDVGEYVFEGGMSVQLANWDPSSGSPQHHFDKQHIINMYEAEHGSPHQADGDSPKTGFFNVRTGAGYNDLFKFLSSTAGFDERQETRNSPPSGPIDPGRTYTIKVEWQGNGHITVFLDDRPLVTHSHGKPFKLRYVFIGTDNAPPGTYGPQYDVIYKNVKVWKSGSGPSLDGGTPPQQDAGVGPEHRIEPVADTWAEPANPNASHGSDPELRVGGDGRTIYLRFQISGVGRASSAMIFMKAMNAGGGGDIHTVADNNWSEAGLTFNNRPSPSAAVLDSLGRVEIGNVYSFDVSTAVPGDGNYSFAITSNLEDGSGYHSRESSDMHPLLVVTSAGPQIPDAGTPQPDAGVEMPHIFGIHLEDEHHFAYAGRKFFFVGKSAFAILAWDDTHMQQFVDESAADGFTQFRVWLMWKRDPESRFASIPQDIWPFGGTVDAPDFNALNSALFDKLERLLGMMEARGIVAEVAPFLCAMDYPGDFNAAMQSYVDEVARRLRSHRNAYLEVANEYNHGCFGGGMTAQVISAAANRFNQTAPSHLVTVSGGGSLSAPDFATDSWLDIIVYHLERNETWWLNPWNVFPGNRHYGKPQVNDEPTGSATQEEYDLWYRDYMGGLGRDTNGEHFRWQFYIAALSGGHSTFHYHKGVTGELGDSPGKQFARPFRTIFEEHVQFWRIEPQAALVQDCGNATCFSAMAGNQHLLYVLGSGATVRFDLGAGERWMRWFNPATGEIVEDRLTAGGVQSLSAPALPDSMLISEPKPHPPFDSGTPPGDPSAGDGGKSPHSEDGGVAGKDGGTAAAAAGGGCGCASAQGSFLAPVLLALFLLPLRRAARRGRAFAE